MTNIEQLAIEHGIRVSTPLIDVGQGNVVSCTLTELEAFAKAYAQQPSEPVSGVVVREGCPTLLHSKYIKPTDIRLYIQPPTTVSLEQYNKVVGALKALRKWHRQSDDIDLTPHGFGDYVEVKDINKIIAEAERSAK